MLQRRYALIVGLTLVMAATGLPASAASLTPVSVPDVRPDVILEGSGWGHGVGMSQYGAYAQSKAGRSAGQILKSYYSSIVIEGGAPNPDMRVALAADPPTDPEGSGLETRPRVKIEITNDASVLWRLCDATGCTEIGQQPRSQTWELYRQPKAGGWKIPATGWTGGTSDHWVEIAYEQSGAIVRGPHLNKRATYRWGLLEVSAKATSNDEVHVISVQQLEKYVRGIGEVPSSWGTSGGTAALRAQAITARTYGLAAYRSSCGPTSSCKSHLGPTPAHQNWVGYDKETEYAGSHWTSAVEATARTVIRDATSKSLIPTYYSSSHGSRSENQEDSWAYGTASANYKSVDDPWSSASSVSNPYRSWTCRASNADAVKHLDAGLSRITNLRAQSATTAGGTPRLLTVGGTTSGGSATKVAWPSNTSKAAGALLRFRPDTRKGLPVTCVRADGKGHVATTLPSQQLRRVGLAPFRDDDGSSHETNIARLSAAGITTGCAADRFCGGKALTRAQMATFLMRSFKELKPVSGSHFKDVSSGSTHGGAIYAIAEAGITKGCARNRFCPDEPLTRAQMAALLQRALELTSAREPFRDVPDDAWYAGSVGAIYQAGVTLGCSKDKYCPNDTVTRAEMASFLVRGLTGGA